MGRWWQANEDRFEYSDRSARLYIAGGEAAGQEMATRCRYSPIGVRQLEGILKSFSVEVEQPELAES